MLGAMRYSYRSIIYRKSKKKKNPNRHIVNNNYPTRCCQYVCHASRGKYIYDIGYSYTSLGRRAKPNLYSMTVVFLDETKKKKSKNDKLLNYNTHTHTYVHVLGTRNAYEKRDFTNIPSKSRHYESVIIIYGARFVP